jgi:hypothetical protein
VCLITIFVLRCKLTFWFCEGQRLAAQKDDAGDIMGAMKAQERALNDQEELSDED